MRPRLVVVDDHPGFRAIARTLLEAEGFDVVGEAADAAAALECARRLEPAIVLVDVQLPDADGFALARALSAADGGPAVILTSTREAEEYGAVVDDCGARGFVPKADLSGRALRALLP